MVKVPDPNSPPRFQWIDETGRVQPLDADVREITDYVMDSSDWPSAKATVHSVLTRTIFDLECEVCHRRHDVCKGQRCVEYFQRTVAVAGKSMCDIKGAGKMGKGVFANRKIPSGSTLGEYLGRLYPLGGPKARDSYIFLITEVAEVSGLQYGNLTRFFNHHCRANVSARVGMYGRRQVILYEASRDIEAGEQLCVDYGRRYFSLPGNPCRCDASEGDHLPAHHGNVMPQVGARSETEVKAPQTSTETLGQRIYTLSKGAPTSPDSGVSTRPSKSSRNPTATSCKKHSQQDPAAVLKSLSRRAGVFRRYGSQVYSSHFLRNLDDKQ
ncbi:hypothetical protein KVR01_013637 [Diaporthe batatas]|uniref:uncharacterized protein n=1 Tax=Diaporthe batatas TaxID=748121 RepID=UPI001D046CF9|nr:uncharacterized protein KVR01_013637 [Diaporthe batatas]KAG8156533.1 hypothetical protein KVR01_013637 [Diaporthe batatas]